MPWNWTCTLDGTTVTAICFVSPVDMLKCVGDWLRLMTLTVAQPWSWKP
jgi:hypothetical protein